MAIIRPRRLPEISVDIGVTPEEALQREEDLRQEWDAQIKRNFENAFKAWKPLKESEGVRIPLESFEELEYEVKGRGAQFNTSTSETDDIFNADDLNFNVNKIQRKPLYSDLYDDFVGYFEEQNRRRYHALPPPLKQLELSRGGVYKENLAIDAFKNNFMRGLTFDLVGADGHRVYGMDPDAQYANWAQAGNVLGSVINFAMLSAATGAIKMPQGIAALAKGTPGAEQAVRAIGYVPAQLRNMTGAFRAIGRFTATQIPKQLILESGAQAINMGIISSVSDLARTGVKKYRAQDSLSPSEYEGSLPQTTYDWLRVAAEGFGRGVVLNVINSPQNWGMRFVGDMFYGIGQQGYRNITGQQEGWDGRRFIEDWITGHLMGEVQGIMFRLPAITMRSFSKIRAFNDYERAIADNPEFRDYSRAEKTAMAHSAWSIEREYINQTKNPMTPSLRKSTLNTVYDLFRGQKNVMDIMSNPDAIVIQSKDFVSKRNLPEKEAIAQIKRVFNLGTEKVNEMLKMNALTDFNTFYKMLPKEAKVRATKPGVYSKKDLSPISVEQFQDSLDRTISMWKQSEMTPEDARIVAELDSLDLSRVISTLNHREIVGEYLVEKVNKGFTEEQLEKIDVFRRRTFDNEFVKNYDGIKLYFGDGKRPKSEVTDMMDELHQRLSDPEEGLPNSYFAERLSWDPHDILREVAADVRNDYDTIREDFKFREDTRTDIVDVKSTPDARSDARFSADLAVLNHISRRSPKDAKNAIINFLHSYRRFGPKHTRLILERYGLSIPQSITRSANAASENSTAGKRAIKDALRREKSKDGKFTKEQARRYFDEANTYKEGLNPITGLETDIETLGFKRDVNDSGAFVLSFADAHRQNIDKYGIEGAFRILQEVSRYIDKSVEAENRDYAHRKDDSYVKIKNPITNDGTDFVFHSRNLSPEEFEGIVRDVFNVLRRRYDPAEVEGRDFKIFRDTPGERFDKIERFDGIKLAFTNKPDEVAILSTEHGLLLGAARDLNQNLYNDLKDVTFDMSDPRIRRAFDILSKGATGETAENVIEGVATDAPRISDEVPATVDASIAAGNEAAIGVSQKVIASAKASIKNSTPRLNEDMFVIEETKKYGWDEGSEVFKDFMEAEEYVKQAQTSSINRAEAAVGFIEARAPEFAGKKVRGIFDYGRNFIDWVKGKVDVTEGYETKSEHGRAVFSQILTHSSKLYTQAENIYAKQMMNVAYRDLYTRLLQNDKNKKYLYHVLSAFAREEEFAGNFKGWEDKSQRDKNEVYKKLLEDIKWKKNADIDIDSIVQNPKNMLKDQSILLKISKLAEDDLVFSKLIVQYLKISPEDYVNQVQKEDVAIYKEAETLNRLHNELEGNYKNLELKQILYKSMPRAMQKRLARYIGQEETTNLVRREQMINKIRNLDLLKNEDMAWYKEVIDRLPQDDQWVQEMQFLHKNFADFKAGGADKLSYVFHRVLQNPYNKNVLKGEINSMLDPERGRIAESVKLKTLLGELSGRTTPTLLNLIERGYNVEVDSYKVQFASMSYMIKKLYNKMFVNNFKKNYLFRVYNAYSQIRGIEEEFVKLRNDETMMDSQRQERMQELVNRKETLIDPFLKMMAEESEAFFFLPSKRNLLTIDRGLKDINNRIEAMNNSEAQDDAAMVKLIDKKKNLQGQKDAMIWLSRIWSGHALTNEKKVLADLFNSSEDEAVIKRTPEEVKEQRRGAELERRKWQKVLGEYIGSHRINEYLPAYMDDYKNDKLYFRKVPGKADDYDVIPDIRKNITDTVKYQKLGAPQLKGFEGIYFNRVVTRMMHQYLYRDDFQYDPNHPGLQKTLSVFDKVNSTLKIMRLWKSSIMMINDTMQAYQRIGFQAFNLKNFVQTYKMFYDRFDPAGEIVIGKTSDGRNIVSSYKLADEVGIFNNVVGIPEVVQTQLRAAFEVGQEKDFLGLRKAARQVGEDVMGAEGGNAADTLIRRLYTGVTKAFRANQDITWTIDKMIRLNTFNTLYKRFASVPGNSLRRAAQLAGELTNNAMVNYSKMPHNTRRFMGRFVTYWTYRWKTLGIYKDMAKNFGKGLTRMFGADPNTDYKISDNRFKQAWFEMAPLVHNLVAQTATKGLLALFLGYTSDDLWDMLFGYRLKRHKDMENPYDRTLEFISLSSPIFEINKYLSRPAYLTMRYNLSAFPGLLLSLFQNRNIITGRPIITVDVANEPVKASAQLGMDLLRTYAPLGSDLANLPQEDLNWMQRVINFFGLGFFYSSDTPRKIMNDFNRAINKAATPAERAAAHKEFYEGINKANRVLFNEEFKPTQEMLEELMKQREINP